MNQTHMPLLTFTPREVLCKKLCHYYHKWSPQAISDFPILVKIIHFVERMNDTCTPVVPLFVLILEDDTQPNVPVPDTPLVETTFSDRPFDEPREFSRETLQGIVRLFFLADCSKFSVPEIITILKHMFTPDIDITTMLRELLYALLLLLNNDELVLSVSLPSTVQWSDDEKLIQLKKRLCTSIYLHLFPLIPFSQSGIQNARTYLRGSEEVTYVQELQRVSGYLVDFLIRVVIVQFGEQLNRLETYYLEDYGYDIFYNVFKPRTMTGRNVMIASERVRILFRALSEDNRNYLDLGWVTLCHVITCLINKDTAFTDIHKCDVVMFSSESRRTIYESAERVFEYHRDLLRTVVAQTRDTIDAAHKQIAKVYLETDSKINKCRDTSMKKRVFVFFDRFVAQTLDIVMSMIRTVKVCQDDVRVRLLLLLTWAQTLGHRSTTFHQNKFQGLYSTTLILPPPYLKSFESYHYYDPDRVAVDVVSAPLLYQYGLRVLLSYESGVDAVYVASCLRYCPLRTPPWNDEAQTQVLKALQLHGAEFPMSYFDHTPFKAETFATCRDILQQKWDYILKINKEELWDKIPEQLLDELLQAEPLLPPQTPTKTKSKGGKKKSPASRKTLSKAKDTSSRQYSSIESSGSWDWQAEIPQLVDFFNSADILALDDTEYETFLTTARKICAENLDVLRSMCTVDAPSKKEQVLFLADLKSYLFQQCGVRGLLEINLRHYEVLHVLHHWIHHHVPPAPLEFDEHDCPRLCFLRDFELKREISLLIHATGSVRDKMKTSLTCSIYQKEYEQHKDAEVIPLFQELFHTDRWLDVLRTGFDVPVPETFYAVLTNQYQSRLAVYKAHCVHDSTQPPLYFIPRTIEIHLSNTMNSLQQIS